MSNFKTDSDFEQKKFSMENQKNQQNENFSNAPNFTKCFFHVDLDAFFSSVEQVVNPELKGKPVIISGDPHRRRNVVSTASYEARRFGVHSALPAIRAYELCPNGIFIEPNMKLYSSYSERIMKILNDFSPDVLQLSIDEACLNMTGTEKLFGAPLEVAKKIKTKIFEETGLTISIGIATNSYLAKICSEINKPDGVFQILPGEEEKFMETLPLKKVWGIGEKTLARLNASGFKTISDIKKHSKNFLKSFLGDASASFLYNVCRGIEPENFRAKPKSHTLSTESTYEFDLIDKDAIETNLLNLCASLMERLLRHGLTSYTVQIKIRYEDFSTISAQETFETPILCTDELYIRIKNLFFKKYEFGRGIRLLGVGVQNVINSTKIIQPELFETGNEKKQTIEKAILDLEIKNPKIKIHKARLLEKSKILILIFSLILNFSSLKKIYAEENSSKGFSTKSLLLNSFRPSTSSTTLNNSGEISNSNSVAPENLPGGTTLFDYVDGDKSYEFFAEGFWNANVFQSSTATFGYGTDFVFSPSLPVFEQEVDLSIWFLLNNHWYVQGAFADKFNKSSFALGYFGDGVVKNVKISNRNIVFPNDYSLTDIGRSIGGGDNQAPGISANFKSEKWSLDAAVRYDMLTSFEKTFYGTSAVNDLKIAKTNFETGSIFIMPSKNITAKVKSIYVEDANGTFFDEANRKYKKLSENEFLIIQNKNTIILSENAKAKKINGVKPCVLIEFVNDADSLFLTDGELGTFGTQEFPGEKYLGSIQKFFGSNLKSDFQNNNENKNYKIPNVAQFSYGGKSQNKKLSVPDKTGQQIEGFFVKLNSKSMLLAQNSIGFSPFVAAFRYDAGINKIEEVQVASNSTEQKSKFYSAVISENIESTKADFFNSKKNFVDVYNPLYTISSAQNNLNSSETNSTSEKISYTSPEINFPFADTSPGTYLGYQDSNDDCIIIRTFSKTSRIDIGTKAVSGTIQVYKNGILDNSAKYNSQTGEITLSSGVSQSDKIYITWFEDSSNYQTGMITGAVGFKYDFFENFSGDIALGTRWALSPNLNYAEENRASNGFVTLASKVQYKTENIDLSNTLGATLQIENLTGNYKISGMDNAKPFTSYLTQDAAKNLPTNFEPFINPRESENENFIELDYSKNCSVAKQSGVHDEKISGYKIPVSYNFSSPQTLSSNEVYWAANTILMNANKNVLFNADKFSVAVKLSEEFILLANDSSINTKIYLQLGVNSEENFTIENKGNIPTWKIFDSKIDSLASSKNYIDVENPISTKNKFGTKNLDWQTISIALTNLDRSNLQENFNARIIITTDKIPENDFVKTGSIFVGPYETSSKGIFTIADSGFSIFTEQLKQQNSSVEKFNKDENYSQNIFWNIQNFDSPSSIFKISDSKISAYKYFEEIDIAQYKNLIFYFSYDVAGDAKPVSEHSISDDGIALTIILDRNAKSAESDGEKSLELKITSNDLQKFITHDSSEFSLIGASSKLHKLEINRLTREVKIDGEKLIHSTLNLNPSIIPTRVKFKINSIVKTQNSSESKLYKKGRFTIDEFYLNESSPKIILQDQIKTKFSKPGDIVKIKDFSLLQDAEIFALGDFISSINTNKNFNDAISDSAKIKFTGNANAKVTIAGIKIANSIGRSSESKNVITSASHFIETQSPLFKMISFSENFTTNNDDKSVSKENSLMLDFNRIFIPINLKGKTKISSDSWSTTNESNNSLQFSIGKNLKYNLLVEEFSNEKKNFSNLNDSVLQKNYFEAWFDATKYQFSIGDENAQKRNIGGKILNTITLPFLNFAPQINFYQTGTYSSSTQNLFSDTTSFETIIPFQIKNQNFSFTYTKSSSQIQNIQKGGNYLTDTKIMCKAMSARDWYFLSFMIYDLISDNLAKKVFASNSNFQNQQNPTSTLFNETAETTSYNGNYELTWRRPIFATKYDLFVPTLFSIAVARDIVAAQNLTDDYQAKASLGYTAVNIFSKNGSVPLFNWCKSDEYNFSFQSTLKIPRNNSQEQSIRQLYSTYLQANFYKENEDVFRTALQFSFQDSANWNGKATFLYKRKSYFSPVIGLVKIFFKKADFSKMNISRTNALNFNIYSTLGNSTNAKKVEYQSIEFSHLVEFILRKEFSINTSADISFSHTKDKICTIGYKLGLGGSLKF